MFLPNEFWKRRFVITAGFARMGHQAMLELVGKAEGIWPSHVCVMCLTCAHGWEHENPLLNQREVDLLTPFGLLQPFTIFQRTIWQIPCVPQLLSPPPQLFPITSIRRELTTKPNWNLKQLVCFQGTEIACLTILLTPHQLWALAKLQPLLKFYCSVYSGSTFLRLLHQSPPRRAGWPLGASCKGLNRPLQEQHSSFFICQELISW